MMTSSDETEAGFSGTVRGTAADVSPITEGIAEEEDADRGCDQRLYLVSEDSPEASSRRALSGL